MPQFVKAGSIGDFPLNEVRHRIIEGEQMGIVRSDSGFYAFSAFCTHVRVSLRGSQVEDRWLWCWLHWSVFNLETGDCIDGPARGNPLTVYPVSLEGDEVYVGIEAGVAPAGE